MDRARSQERDRSTARINARSSARSDQARDQARIRQLATQWRTMEQAHHTGVEPRLRKTRRHRRAAARHTGRYRGAAERREESIPRNATKWRSDDAMVVAADGLARSDEYQKARASAEASGQQGFKAIRPLAEVLGPGWRADVYGRRAASRGAQASQWNDNSTAKAAGDGKVMGGGTRSPAIRSQASEYRTVRAARQHVTDKREERA